MSAQRRVRRKQKTRKRSNLQKVVKNLVKIDPPIPCQFCEFPIGSGFRSPIKEGQTICFCRKCGGRFGFEIVEGEPPKPSLWGRVRGWFRRG